MEGAQTYKDLRAWQVSVDLVESIYRVTERYPRSELFGLVSQMRRAAVSVGANIAEGNSRSSRAAYVNHLAIALGSLGEVRALLEISRRLAFIQSGDVRAVCVQLDECGRLLHGLRRSLERREEERPDP